MDQAAGLGAVTLDARNCLTGNRAWLQKNQYPQSENPLGELFLQGYHQSQ